MTDTPTPPREATYTIEHDGFQGTVQGSYVTREGKRGVVLQQVGTRVVHVYGEKWLNLPPAAPPPASDDEVGEMVERLAAAVDWPKGALWHEWLASVNAERKAAADLLARLAAERDSWIAAYDASNRAAKGHLDAAEAALEKALEALCVASDGIQHLREMTGFWSADQRQAFLNGIEQTARAALAAMGARDEP